jgi:AhpD family alkylhydroperoxidase
MNRTFLSVLESRPVIALLLTFALLSALYAPAADAGTRAGKKAQSTAIAPTKPMSQEAQAAYKDIQETLGQVPTFFHAMPDSAIEGAWAEMKNVQMNPNTALPGKYKELIGLAVSAQIPCKYCIYFHTEAAKTNGATEQEIKEAVAIAANSRQWSTLWNGMQVDEAQFRADTSKMVDHVKAMMAKPPMDTAMVQPSILTVDDVTRDMEAMFGFVPTFAKVLPAEGLVGAWKELKGLDMNPESALPGKIKDLMSLAVAAQTPCKYCTYLDTEFAMKVNGASDREVREAVAMSALVRHWSTVLNGNQVDEAQFRREVDHVFARARNAAAQPEPRSSARLKAAQK